MSLHLLPLLLAAAAFLPSLQCCYVKVPIKGDRGFVITEGAENGSEHEAVDCLKGEAGPKGETGAEGGKGATGPRGQTGSKGRSGQKGDKCDMGPEGICQDFDDFKRDVRNRMGELERLVLPPDTCSTSSANGYQASRRGIETYCDNGWTVFQRRFDGSVDFDRNWQEYKVGFGNIADGEFWWGLEKVHRITSSKNCRLRIDLKGYDGSTAYVQYSSFSIGEESDNYSLHVAGYSGTAGDSLITSSDDADYVHNEMQFTTHDNYKSPKYCFLASFGYLCRGWWHTNCCRSYLNGAWGWMIWYSREGNSERVEESMMKLKCN